MLLVIGYDLESPWDYSQLREGVAEAGGGIDLLDGPWIYGGDLGPHEVLRRVKDQLKGMGRFNDRLLVFPVRMGEVGTGRNLPQEPITCTQGTKVLAVAYTLRNPLGFHHVDQKDQERHRRALTKAIQSIGHKEDRCRPLGALWFVRTQESAHDVRLAIEKDVPLTPKDELMVVEVNTQVKGSCTDNLAPEHRKWLKEAGVIEDFVKRPPVLMRGAMDSAYKTFSGMPTAQALVLSIGVIAAWIIWIIMSGARDYVLEIVNERILHGVPLEVIQVAFEIGWLVFYYGWKRVARSFAALRGMKLSEIRRTMRKAKNSGRPAPLAVAVASTMRGGK